MRGILIPVRPTLGRFIRPSAVPNAWERGYLGRRAIYEVYRVNEELRNIIYKSQDLIEMRKAMDRSGTLNLRGNGWRKVVKGLTTVEEILNITTED